MRLDPKHDIYPPHRMAHLPRDHRGFLVPKFVWRKDDGTYDFRVVQPDWLMHCIRYKTCWLCGERLGRNLCFVIGPMCALNRASGEPPNHLECSRYAVRVCPFMIRPRMRRNEKGLDEIDGSVNPMGLNRNPGAAGIYVTGSYKWMSDVKVIRMGPPDRIEWWCEGRAATRAEVEHSIETGLPLLRAEEEGPAAVAELQRSYDAIKPFLPAS